MFKLYFVPDLFIFRHYITYINKKYKIYDLSDNLVLAVPLHSHALGAQPCFTAHTSESGSRWSRRNISIIIMHAALQVAFLWVLLRAGVELTLS